MKHHIRAVLFDLDGVVVLTDKYHYLAWKRLADEEGWQFDWEVNHACRGIPRLASLQVILDHNHLDLPPAEKEKLATRKNGYYLESLKNINAADLYPGAVDFIGKLKAEGVKVALCSSSKNAQAVLDALQLGPLFDTVVTGHDLARAKPDPQIFLLTAERLRIPAFHCLVFEDAVSGVEAAFAAKMKAVGVGKAENLPNAPEVIEHFDGIDLEALLDTARVHRPPGEPWAVTETRVRPGRLPYWETIFALSNGLLGWRGSLEEEDEKINAHAYPAFFINGVYGYEPYHHIWKFPGFAESLHAMLNLCHWGIVNLWVEGEKFSMAAGTVSDYRRSLNLKTGVLERSFVWQSPAGKRVAVKTKRLVSMTRRHSAAFRYEVTPLDPCRLTLENKVILKMKSQVLPGEQTEMAEFKRGKKCDTVLMRTTKGPFQIGLAFSQTLSPQEGVKEAVQKTKEGILARRYECDATANQTVALESFGTFYSTVETRDSELLARAVDDAVKNCADGFAALQKEQAEFWARHWENADIMIDGSVRDQQALRFTLFHLRQSAPEDDRRSIGANSLTGDKYCGHVFWDTEMYISPNYLYTEPRLVRSLLMYRYHLLDRARARAAQMQGRGALYAWNSISGEECGVVFEAATAEWHLLNAIAFGIHRYVSQTGDAEFLFDYGAEILFETARYLAHYGAFVPHRGGKFCLNVVCGPDEYGCGVNNNCYTNVMTQWHFRHASAVYERMQKEAPEKLARLVEKIGLKNEEVEFWRRAADRMLIPFNEELGIHEQDDSFLNLAPVDMDLIPRHTDIRELMHPLNLWKLQVAKQADVVLLMFVQGQQFSREVKRANYEFYEPRTCHGSSLSSCIHSIVAAEIGRAEEAYDYFRQSVLMDLNDFKNNTAGGIHSACLGGTWMAVVNGFGGMRDYQDGLHFAPVLPRAWQGYRFKIVYRGSKLAINVLPGRIEYRLLEGGPLTFRSYAQPVTLSPARPFHAYDLPSY